MPRLHELRPLPEEVGGVPIVWFDPKKEDKGAGRIAGRERDKLFLPNQWYNDFYPLGGGKLLFVDGNPDRSRLTKYSFCGMDETPFHVFVSWDAVGAFIDGGAESFFEALVPPLMKQLRKRPDIPDSWERQGDWFAKRLPFSWEDIGRTVSLATGRELQIETVKKERLGGTRHLLNGKIVSSVPLFGTKFTMVEGVISAPDHHDLVLAGGPHAVAQAANLVDPEGAD